MISITAILGNTSFVVCQCVRLFLFIFKGYAFHIIMALYHTRLILEEERRVQVIMGARKK